jgi:hypothetical protein
LAGSWEPNKGTDNPPPQGCQSSTASAEWRRARSAWMARFSTTQTSASSSRSSAIRYPRPTRTFSACSAWEPPTTPLEGGTEGGDSGGPQPPPFNRTVNLTPRPTGRPPLYAKTGATGTHLFTYLTLLRSLNLNWRSGASLSQGRQQNRIGPWAEKF